MAQRDDAQITPTRSEAGVTTAPTLSAAEEIAELRAEVERLKAKRLKAKLDDQHQPAPAASAWPTEITYPKGQVFQDLVPLEANAVDEAPLIERFLEKVLGKSFYLGTAHGSIVHRAVGGG